MILLLCPSFKRNGSIETEYRTIIRPCTWRYKRVKPLPWRLCWDTEPSFTSEVNNGSYDDCCQSIRIYSPNANTAGPLQEPPLHIAARTKEGGEKCVQMLLKSGADVNITRADGVTPLHVAAQQGYTAVVQLLLADGADPWLQNHVISKQIKI